MEIVIDIPERIYDTIQADEMISREQLAVLQMHILEVTPLPKHHGRLADLDAALKCVEEVTDSKEKEYAIALFDWAMSKRVIIPATEEGES